MGMAARLDDLGKPAWIALMITGFILFWPVGLMVLAYLIGSGRMGCWHHGDRENWRERRDHFREAARAWCAGGGQGRHSSGNRAFDEYRDETLRRLEEEQREFMAFLDRLRFAKDKAEFDQFLAERRNRPTTPEAQPQL